MLRVALKNAVQMRIESREDLHSLIPSRFGGEVLNYGQGEGQLKIGDTVWGVYAGDDGRYYFTLEEGLIEFELAVKLAEAIIEQVRAKWGQEICGELKGVFHDDPAMRSTQIDASA